MKNSTIFLSHIIKEGIPTYGNRDFVKIKQKASIEKGDTANTSEWYFSINHIGTHIDVPKHFYNDGKSITDYPADYWIYNEVGLVEIEVYEHRIISEHKPFEKISNDIELLLIKTGFERFRGNDKYWKDSPGIAPELAEFFRGKFPKLRAIGFDFISLTALKNRTMGKQAHLTFLKPERPIHIIEDMALKDVNSKIKVHRITISPLRVEKADGSSVTIIAEVEQ